MTIKSLKIKIRKLIEDSFPDAVEFIFLDVHKKQHTFIEKIVVFTDVFSEAQILNKLRTPNPKLPFESKMEVEMMKEWTNERAEKIVLINTLYHIESTTGQTEFEVLASQLIDSKSEEEIQK